MSRFTKATLLIAGLILAVAAETAIVSRMFVEREGFFIGGEWLVPAVVWGAYIAGREIRRLYRTVRGDTNG